MSPERTKQNIEKENTLATLICAIVKKGKYQGKTVGRTRSIFTKAKLSKRNH